jgi:hypothetical protein
MATAARIAARQQKDGDGITSQLADQMHNRLASRHMAIVELAVDEVANSEDGTGKVKLIIETIEIAPAGPLEDHLRDTQKHLWGARQEQPTLMDGETVPTVGDIITDGQALTTQPA